SAAPCYTYAFDHAPGRYVLPGTVTAIVAAAKASQWITLQADLLVTGYQAGQWACRDPDPREHWTYATARYCSHDFRSVASAPAGMPVADRATVAAAWGRSVTVPPGRVASIVLSPGQATILAGATQVFRVEGFDAGGSDLGDVTPQASFAIGGSGSCQANACG